MKTLRLIFADGSWVYNGNSPENKPLGGSESALVYLTRALAKLGHDVRVYNNCNTPGIYHGVHYHRLKEIKQANRFIYSDAFISLRNPRVFRLWLNSGACILWAQDAFDQTYLQNLKSNADIRRNIDSIFCISRWQAWTFMNHFHWPKQKIFLTRNAIWPEYFPNKFLEPEGHRMVYTSTPFRGLELLLQLFPKIYQSVPKAELHVFSSMQVYQQSKEDDQKEHGHIYNLAKQPGVIMHGSVGQKELASELVKCRVFAYPNIFPETSCIAAMEALAAGCAAVTSRLAALPETVGPGGVLINGMPGTDTFNEAFVENCIRLLTDQTFWRKNAIAGRDWILNHFTWEKVALEWSEQINKIVQRNQQTVDDLEGWQPEIRWSDKQHA